MERMKISVVMACYNGRTYIRKQLDSIRKQTCKAQEFIIVDDCSCDGTADIVGRYIEKYRCSGWKLVRNGHNTGYVKAFEKAVALSTGDIIFLADQDDIWSPKKIEIMSYVMHKYRGILSLCTSFSGIDPNSCPIPVRRPFLTENHGLILLRHMKKNGLYRLDFRDIMQRNAAMGCTMAIRRELAQLYLECPHTEDIPHDWKLNFLAASRNGLFFLNRELISYRIHSQNTIGLKTDSAQIDQIYRIQEYQRYISSCREMKKILVALPSAFRHPDRYIKKIARTEQFYRDRITAIKKGDALRTVLLVAKYFPHFGPYAVLALMDIVPPSKCSAP